MKPIDIRNKNFERLKAELSSLRERVWSAWVTHGPCTTAELARRSGIPILALRPRTTELYQAGLVKLIDHADGEGIYMHREPAEWEEWAATQCGPLKTGQLQLV